MDGPFTIYLDVEQKNITNALYELSISNYPINITIDHTIGDIKQLVWKNSQNYSLKPAFLTITYRGRVVGDNERLCDVLQTPQAPSQAVLHSFKLIIDHALSNSQSIPSRDPVEELFDIVIEWKDTLGANQIIKIRETLDCTIGVLKDSIMEQRNRRGNNEFTSGDSFDLVLKATNSVCTQNDERLSRIIKLDVTPLRPVTFKICPKDVEDTSPRASNRRFRIKINSTVSVLDEGHSIFDVNSRTTLQEFKQQIIDRLDYQSVRRTFFDQVRLYYAAQLINNTVELNDKPLYDILLLDDILLDQENGIIVMNLEISDNVGGNGVLSREFWNDIRADNRFEFSPNSRDNLLHTNRSIEGSISPIEPTRIILENGAEWNLTGESYEIIQPAEGNLGSQRKLLVNQSNLASVEYEFALNVRGENEPRKVKLNTSQCIIVDKGTHHPYVLLSPSGASRLNGVFRLTTGEPLIQKVEVQMYNEQQNDANGIQDMQIGNNAELVDALNNAGHNNNQANIAFQVGNGREAIVNNAIELVRNNYRTWIGSLMRYIFVIYILGLNTLLLGVWKEIVGLGLIGAFVYTVFFAGNAVADWIEQTFVLDNVNDIPRRIDQILLANLSKFFRLTDNITSEVSNVIRSELTHVAVERTREYEYVCKHEFEQDTYWFYLTDTFTNLWKDLLLMCLTLMPSFHARIYEELERWRSTEVDDLVLEVKILQELTVHAIEVRRLGHHDPHASGEIIRHNTGHSFILDEDEAQSATAPSNTALEERYQSLLDYYIKLHKLHTDIGKIVSAYERESSGTNHAVD